MFNSRMLILLVIVMLAAAARFLPHPPNFTPLLAIALFGGAYFADKRMAFLLPVLVMFLSDIFLGFHGVMIFVYLCFAATVWMGIKMRGKISFLPVVGGAAGASVLFFIVTNFGVWLTSAMYPLTFEGLLMCYTAAIPFFHNTLAGTLVYSTALFGGFEYIQSRYPDLRLQSREV